MYHGLSLWIPLFSESCWLSSSNSSRHHSPILSPIKLTYHLLSNSHNHWTIVRVSWALDLFRNVYSVLVLWWSRCLLVSSCLRTELLCFSPGLIRLTGPEPGLPASLLAPGLAWQSKLLRYRHVSLMSVLLLLSHAFLASDAVDFYPQYTFIFIFWNLLALVGRCSN